MENKCRWYFGKNETGVDPGPNDSIQITFPDDDFGPIVREAIQNSLDAVSDPTHSVEVRFTFNTLSRIIYCSFFNELKNCMRKCLAYYERDERAQTVVGNMLKYLQKNNTRVDYLTISDYNTLGMPYLKDDAESPFNSFLHSEGKSTKGDTGAGGSFGFGKGAYFALSNIKTILVTSRDSKNNIAFEGVTRLTTHLDDDLIKRSAYGFYNIDGTGPVENEREIPEDFRRLRPGTDFHIIGINNNLDREAQIIRSVLNNFWLAIYNKKLIVNVDGREINKDNLDAIISKYYNDVNEGSIRNVKKWNPKPYYFAVSRSGRNDDYILFKGDLPNLKEVKLFVYRLNPKLPNRISYFRKPNMLVYKRGNTKLENYAGVFICENNRGNELLRKMENPEHDKWSSKYVVDDKKIDKKIARDIEKEIEDFINEKLSSLIDIGNSDRSDFYGLAEYLSIVEDLLEEDEDLLYEGGASGNTYGEESDKESERETGAQTTDHQSVAIKPKVKEKKKDIKDLVDVKADEGGELAITLGGPSQASGGDRTAPHPEGETIGPGSSGDNAQPARVFIKVDCNIAAQHEDDILYHHLIIMSPNDIHNAEIELFVGSDNGLDTKVEIIDTDKGKIFGNSIRNISLTTGKNLLKIRFDDDMKHSIELRAYELF